MENIILQINNALNNQGISQTAIAKKIEVDQKTVNRLLAGKTKKPDIKVIEALISELGIEVDVPGEKQKEFVPIFHMAGAGPPRLSSGAVVATVTLPEGFYRLGIIPVKIFGNSMEPVFLDGAIVGVDLHDREYVPGRYYAVWIEDQGAVIKKLSSEPGRIYVESLNKNEHSFYIDREAISDHFILGRVKWWINQDK